MQVNRDGTVTVNIPLAPKNKTQIIVPEHAKPNPQIQENALIKALVSAHLWRKQLRSETYRTIKDLAESHHKPKSYVEKIMRLNYLAPSVKLAILQNRLPETVHIKTFAEKPIPCEWHKQDLLYLGV